MKNLRDKLNQLYNKPETALPEENTSDSGLRRDLDRLFQHQPVKHFAKSEVEKSQLTLPELVPGSWINTAFGDIFRGEFEYPLDEFYGSLDLRKIFDFNPQFIAATFSLNDVVDPQKLLFIDTETTGLAGGSGTVAFMIGVGWIEPDKFVVHQYFITQLSHEEGMLDLLGELLRQFDGLVSFNGKTYDIPLLTTRFVMNRLMPEIQNKPHIDLLHPTRSLWKHSMENCKLKTVEIEHLGLYREEDIPGELIPQVYFDYLRDGNADRIERIFYHNRFDIISMLANLILILQAWQQQHPEKDPRTDFAKGRIFKRRKDLERSITHYTNVLAGEISDTRRSKTLLELAAIYKSMDNYKAAVELWEKACAPELPFMLEAWTELAKYYEHKSKDFEQAFNIIQKSLARLPERRVDDRLELEKRLDRIQQKQTKRKGK